MLIAWKAYEEYRFYYAHQRAMELLGEPEKPDVVNRPGWHHSRAGLCDQAVKDDRDWEGTANPPSLRGEVTMFIESHSADVCDPCPIDPAGEAVPERRSNLLARGGMARL